MHSQKHACKKKVCTLGDIRRNRYGAADSPQKITARTIRIDFYGKFGRFLKVVKLFSVRTLDSLVKEDHTFFSKECQ